MDPDNELSTEVLPGPPEPELEDETGEQALISQIPHMSGGTRMAALKADYLGYRATGFPIRQACYLANVSQATLGRWRRSDPDFVNVETNRLPELQSKAGGELVRLEFLRNMRLAMRTDFKILYKAVHHLESLSDREFQYLKRVRGMYAPSDLLTVSRALTPDSGSPTDFAEIVMSLTQTQLKVKVTRDGQGDQEQPTPKPDIIEGQSSPA